MTTESLPYGIKLAPTERVYITFQHPDKDCYHTVSVEYHAFDNLIQVQHEPDEDSVNLTYYFSASS